MVHTVDVYSTVTVFITEPGEFQFEKDHCVADLQDGTLTTKIIREHGFDGKVNLEYATM